MKNLVAQFFFCIVLSFQLTAQHPDNHSCDHGSALQAVRNFDAETQLLIEKQSKLEEQVYLLIETIAGLVRKDPNEAKRILEEKVKPALIKYKETAQVIHTSLFPDPKLEKTIRVLLAIPEPIFKDSGLEWEEFIAPFYYTYETLLNNMLDMHQELEQYDVDLVHVELVPGGNYLSNCDDNKILDELRTAGDNDYPELEYLRSLKECWQAHMLSFIVPPTCNADKGIATQTSLASMQFQKLYSIVRYDLITSESLIPIHELGHNLTLQHGNYFFDMDLNMMSVMFEYYNSMFAGEFFSELSAAKLMNAIPLMLSLGSPLSLKIDELDLEICEGENIVLGAEAVNGNLDVLSSDTTLQYHLTDSGIELIGEAPGNYTLQISASNDEYCYQLPGKEIDIVILDKEILDTVVTIDSGSELVLLDGTIVSERGTYTIVESGTADNGCDIIWNYEVKVLPLVEELETMEVALIDTILVTETLMIEREERNFYEIEIYNVVDENVFIEIYSEIIEVGSLNEGLYMVLKDAEGNKLIGRFYKI